MHHYTRKGCVKYTWAINDITSKIMNLIIYPLFIIAINKYDSKKSIIYFNNNIF